MTADGTASTTPVCPSDQLSLDEYKRYGRQMILDGFGLPGQLKLKAARVAVIGAGGLGCPTLQYLVGAGVGMLRCEAVQERLGMLMSLATMFTLEGYIGIIDFDRVEESNLHRQILHTTDRVGWYKADSAKSALEASVFAPTDSVGTLDAF
jgi:adenylyltransferase/sulfurtransferase